jgi:hypothetical protein
VNFFPLFFLLLPRSPFSHSGLALIPDLFKRDDERGSAIGKVRSDPPGLNSGLPPRLVVLIVLNASDLGLLSGSVDYGRCSPRRHGTLSGLRLIFLSWAVSDGLFCR